MASSRNRKGEGKPQWWDYSKYVRVAVGDGQCSSIVAAWWWWCPYSWVKRGAPKNKRWSTKTCIVQTIAKWLSEIAKERSVQILFFFFFFNPKEFIRISCIGRLHFTCKLIRLSKSYYAKRAVASFFKKYRLHFNRFWQLCASSKYRYFYIVWLL